MIFEYAATLGLVDLAYTHPNETRTDFHDLWGSDTLYFLSRYDGLEYFRLNSLGAYCLGHKPSYESKVLPSRTRSAIYPDLRIQTEATPPPDERLTLEAFADQESDDVWRLSLARTLESIENGRTSDDLRDFLTTRDTQPRPEMVEGFLRKVEAGSNALSKSESAILLKCASAEIADILCVHKRTGKYCQRVGKPHVVVKISNEKRFRRAAHEIGYAMPKH